MSFLLRNLDAPLESIEQIQDPILKADYKRIVDTIVGQINAYVEVFKERDSAISVYKKSLTIGFEGSWGSGKTTLLNFIRNELVRERKKELIVSFNPWYVPNEETITSHFFHNLANSLKKGKIQKQIRDDFLELALIFDPDIISMGIGITNPLIFLVLRVLSVCYKRLAKRISEKKASLYEIKESLSNSLLKLKDPIIIVIDDLDRMQPQCLRTFMSLFKSIGDLPNIVYLIAYDRQIVTSIMSADGIDGNEYIEKVIQISFPIPKQNHETVEAFLNNNFRQGEGSYNLHESIEVLNNVLGIYIKTFRKAKQILNRFNYRMHYNYGQLNEIDLYLLSLIEVLYPKVAYLLRELRPIPRAGYSFPDIGLSNLRQRQVTFLVEVLGYLNIPKEMMEICCEQLGDKGALDTQYDLNFIQLENMNLLDFLLHNLLGYHIVKQYNVVSLFPELPRLRHKHRLCEETHFDFYFEFNDDHGFSVTEYNKYMKKLSESKENAANQISKDPVMLFHLLSNIRYELEEYQYDNYLILLKYVMRHIYKKGCENIFYLTIDILKTIYKRPQYMEKVISLLINNKTHVVYLIRFYDDIQREIPDRFKEDEMYKLKILEEQIPIKIKEQSKILIDCIELSRVLFYMNKNQNDSMRGIAREMLKSISDAYKTIEAYSYKTNGIVTKINLDAMSKLFELPEVKKMIADQATAIELSDKYKQIYNIFNRDYSKLYDDESQK